MSTGWRTHWNSLWVASSFKLQNLTWIWPMLIRKNTINFWICAVDLRCYMHIKIWYLKYFKVLCITHEVSNIHTQKMCINLYFFKEIWSSSCIDGHDLYIISNLCLHRNCQVVSLQTFKNHFTLLISLEFLVVLSYHLVTQIMYSTLCFINGTLDPFKGKSHACYDAIVLASSTTEVLKGVLYQYPQVDM